MKHVKKFAGFLLFLIMVLSLSVNAFAAGTGTITINEANKGNTYKVYKVFNANGNGTNIAYSLVSGKTIAPAGFTVDSTTQNVTYTGDGTDGNLTAEDITAIAGYVSAADLVKTVEAKSDTVEISGLTNGYYYITTTTGTAVTITSTNPNAAVEDKNEAPVLDKKITGVVDGSFDADGKKALAEVGTTVSFTATIEVKAGAVGYVFHDKMDAGLAYDESSLRVNGEEVEAGNTNYDKTTASGDTITLTFDDSWIKTQIGKTITITYNATVTSAALTVDAAKNTAKVNYGHDGHTNTTPEKETEVYNAKFTVTKTDGSNPLAGAGFVLTKKDGGNTVYYKKNGDVVVWVANIAEATELLTTDAEGGNVIAFTGLADGEYTLVEKTVPDGYNKAKDTTFTVVGHNYTADNLEQKATVINQAGSLLPSTGGMGTTIFYVAGSILLIGAVVLLVTKKRMSNKD